MKSRFERWAMTALAVSLVSVGGCGSAKPKPGGPPVATLVGMGGGELTRTAVTAIAGTPCVAFILGSGGTSAASVHVRCRQDGQWVDVGGGPVDTALGVEDVALVSDGATLFVAYSGTAGGNGVLRVRSAPGVQGPWSDLGDQDAAPGEAEVQVIGGAVYVGYLDAQLGHPVVARRSGAGWERIGSAPALESVSKGAAASRISLFGVEPKVDVGDPILYLAYDATQTGESAHDPDRPPGIPSDFTMNVLRVARWTGAWWEHLGDSVGSGFIASENKDVDLEHVVLVLANDVPWVSFRWPAASPGNQAIRRYDESAGTWKSIGSNQPPGGALSVVSGWVGDVVLTVARAAYPEPKAGGGSRLRFVQFGETIAGSDIEASGWLPFGDPDEAFPDTASVRDVSIHVRSGCVYIAFIRSTTAGTDNDEVRLYEPGGCTPEPLSYAPVPDGTTAQQIAAEVSKDTDDPGGWPLPVATQFISNPAAPAHALVSGSKFFHPDWHMDLIEQSGYHILVPFWHTGEISPDYEAALDRAESLSLPISITYGDVLRHVTYEPHLSLPFAKNPNRFVHPSTTTAAASKVPNPDGTDPKEVLQGALDPHFEAPGGPGHPWYEAGWKVTNPKHTIETIYPEPPRVFLTLNNEDPRSRQNHMENSTRFRQLYGAGQNHIFKREKIFDGFRTLDGYTNDGLIAGWSTQHYRDHFTAVPYRGAAAWVGREGRWQTWGSYVDYHVGVGVQPFGFSYRAISASNYLCNGQTCPDNTSDFLVFSPHLHAINILWQERLIMKAVPELWHEMAAWDGNAVGHTKMKIVDPLTKEPLTAARYQGMYQFALWLTRSRALREFRYKHGIDGVTPAGETWGDMFIALARACSRVWNDDLVKFWRKGTLVVNEAFDWPWDVNVTDEWSVPATEKRYILSASPGQPETWSIDKQVDVWALALLYDDGKNPKEWLVLVHSPLENTPSTTITVPGYGSFAVENPSAKGEFYILREGAGVIKTIPSL